MKASFTDKDLRLPRPFPFLFLFLLLSLFSCRKQSQNESPAEKIAGTYSCIRYSFFWSFFQPYYTFDTIQPATLVVTQKTDSSVEVEGKVLVYQGVYNNSYVFLSSVSSPELYTFSMVQSLDSLKYTYENGGLAGGYGYVYSWKK